MFVMYFLERADGPLLRGSFEIREANDWQHCVGSAYNRRVIAESVWLVPGTYEE